MKMKQETIRFVPKYSNSGIEIRFTRKHIDVIGWYDTYVGIEGGILTWDELDAIRQRLFERTKKPKEEVSK